MVAHFGETAFARADSLAFQPKLVEDDFAGLPAVHVRASRYSGQPSLACQP
jgi:hypothetical protein